MSSKEVAAFAKLAGLQLDPEQIRWLESTFAVDDEGRWRSRQVHYPARQASTTKHLIFRCLVGLFILGEQRILWAGPGWRSVDTDCRRIVELIRAVPILHEQVRRYVFLNGGQGIELKSGARLIFASWQGRGVRGLSADTVIVDAASPISDAQHLDLAIVTVRSRNPQIWHPA